MNKRVAHTAELIATIRSEQSKSLSALRGLPTGETIVSRNENPRKRLRPAKARPVTTRASTPSSELYVRLPLQGAKHRTLDVSQSHYDSMQRQQRQQYRQHAFMALIGGMIVGLAITLL